MKKKTKLTLLNLKVTEDEREALVIQAALYTYGNLSEWLRIAGMNFKPKKKSSRK